MWAAKVTGWELACRKARFWKGLVLLTTRRVLSIFFRRVELHRQRLERPVEVAMEGYNGWARPLDQQIQQRDYRLLNVNNLKLARFKEIFPAPAKNDHIDTDKMLELFQLGDTLARAKNVIQEVKPVPEENRQLKRLTRRRRQLVVEKVRLGNRLKADLQAVCPELADLTGSIDNRWFLSFMTARKNLRQLEPATAQQCIEDQRDRFVLRRHHPKLAERRLLFSGGAVGGGDDPQRCPTDAGIARADWPVGASHRAPDSELRNGPKDR